MITTLISGKIIPIDNPEITILYLTLPNTIELQTILPTITAKTLKVGGEFEIEGDLDDYNVLEEEDSVVEEVSS